MNWGVAWEKIQRRVLKKPHEKGKKCGLCGKTEIIESIKDKLEEKESCKRLL